MNGFIFAIFGIYDYFVMTSDSSAYEMLQQTLGTVRNYIPIFRRPGKPSYYGLRFGHFAANYHALHIKQLEHLYKMTQEPFFRNWADTFYSDYHN